ncbi:hypothetical protein IAR55_004538 [Kwoniella newhampshirensis]|uniref:DUF985 domain-containing protein n=1 Tax=Kwoniella newhampshirensis TaxID=1651941 RepID=A0AAW0YXV0_9TREE
MSISPPYPYPVSNSELISAHSLIKHFEGGYFAQTVAIESTRPRPEKTDTDTDPDNDSKVDNPSVPRSRALEGRVQIPSGPGAELLSGGRSQSGEEKEKEKEKNRSVTEPKMDATLIYYLLSPDSYRGRMHMNLHSTFHLHHSGRALYTLIQPPSLSPSSSSSPSQPTIHRIVVGPNPSLGEVTQLFVPGGWWKASEIPDEDLLLLSSPEAERSGLKDKIGCLISEVVVPGWNPDQHQFIDEDKLKATWGGQPGWEQYTKYIKAPEGLVYPDK